MAKHNPDVEMIAAPNMLQIKVGGPIGAADLHLIEKAENALNTRLASSMTKIIDMPEKRQVAPVALVLAHVNAIRAALVQNIRDTSDPVAAELADELEVMATAFAAPWKDEAQPAAARG